MNQEMFEALCESYWYERDLRRFPDHLRVVWEDALPNVRAAVADQMAAVVRRLRVEGFVIVPAEPTEAMRAAVLSALPEVVENGPFGSIEIADDAGDRIARAVISAAATDEGTDA